MRDILKDRLKRGDVVHGMFIMLPSPGLVEMAGHAGLDYVVMDTEHGASGTEMLEHQIRAAEATGITPLVRPASQNRDEILRALEAGAHGIVVPHVSTVEQAEAIVRAAHYPPHGVRGLATTSRSGNHGFTTVAEHLERARRRTLVIVQIEDVEALPNVAAIARVEGVDAVFMGPADLAISLGYPGQLDHPVVVEKLAGIIRDVKEAGQVLAGFARAEEDAGALVRQGVGFVCLSSTLLIAARFKELAGNLRQL